jgi:hypothetical protein
VAGVACDLVHVEDEHPYRAIIDTAASKGCDLIVKASRGRHGISAIILGSETLKVLTHCEIPVLVHRRVAPRLMGLVHDRLARDFRDREKFNSLPASVGKDP